VKRGKLQGKAAIGLIVGGDIVLLVFGWFLLIGPQKATSASIVRATAAAEAQLTEAKKPIVPVKPAAVQKQPVIRTADLYSLANAMPPTTDMPDLLLELGQVARGAGVKLKTISPNAGGGATTGSYTTLPINLTFTGDFYSLTDLLYRLRSLVTVRHGELQTSGRLFSIDSVSFAPVGAGTELNATVTLNAFIYGGAPAATAATSAVPPPASTDTTTTATSTAPSADVAPAP
jgi:Tfp pilus assembly protein PilO